MASIQCKACGRIYDYNKQDMCPKCGAYNRPPHRERVDPDGTIHFLDQQDTPPRRGKVCYEEKTCHEEKTCYEQQPRAARSAGHGGVQRLSERFGSMDKKKREALIGVAAVVLILLIPLLKARARYSYVINYGTQEPVAPAEEAVPDYGLYEPMLTFEVYGKTASLTEIFVTQDEISITVEGLAAYAPEPYLCICGADGIDVGNHPVSIMEWGDSVEYTFDRAAYLEHDPTDWFLQFETDDGMAEVCLTEYLS